LTSAGNKKCKNCWTTNA